MNDKPLVMGDEVQLKVTQKEGLMTLTMWRSLNPGEAYDVVGRAASPTPSEVLSTIHIHTSTDMERLGYILGFIEHSSPSVENMITLQESEWVAWDEAGHELCRDRSYWKVRDRALTHCEVIDIPLDVLPSTGDTWRHHKGNEYEVLLLSNQYSQQPEYPPTVVYQGANGKVWSKSLVNFLKKMTFVRKAEEVECGTLDVPTLGITGVRPGSTWTNDGADFPTADIDLRYSKESGRCEAEIWYGAIHATARTAEQAEELRDLIIKGLEMATTLRDSLDFEGLLAQYHEKVWNAASSEGATVHDEDGCQDYDLAGVDVTKKLIAMFRGEEKYTHHLDMPIIEGLDLSKCTVFAPPFTEEAKEQFIEAWGAADKSVHPLIEVLNDKDQMAEIAKRATEAQLTQLAEWSGEQPKTFGCHHNSETCGLCHDMVMRWKEKQKQATQAEPEGDHMFERFIRPSD